MTTTDATFAREITPEYETVGKRRRLVGYTMWLDSLNILAAATGGDGKADGRTPPK